MTSTDLQTALAKYAEAWDTALPEKLTGIAANCPHCGVFASFDQLTAAGIAAGTILASLRAGGLARQLIQLQCPSCKQLSIVASAYEPPQDGRRSLSLQLLWPPTIRPDRAPETLCVGPRRDYDQARQVLSVSPTAAALLTRRCLQHVLRTKLKVAPSSLFKEIGEAIGRSELSSHTRNALDHVRRIGNFAAHPEVDQAALVTDVSAEEARYTLEVLERLFDDLYRIPDQIRQMSSRLQPGPRTPVNP
jgi:hypothetical protein